MIESRRGPSDEGGAPEPAVQVGRCALDVGRAAAAAVAAVIRHAIEQRGRARVVFASAPSQESMLAALVDDPAVDWSRVHAFHMDEYVGIDTTDARAFGQWLEDRLSIAGPARLERIRPGDDPVGEAGRYAAQLAAAPMDLTCMGIGVNGHIAFNEPGSARFDDPERVRVVRLDPTSRQQQVDEGLFGELQEVPNEAVTLTVPALLAADALVVTVLGDAKADAVAAALAGPIDPRCPASAIRMHPNASVHLDRAAAAAV